MRKIIQIQQVPDTENYEGCLVALCDDGTLWYLQRGVWNVAAPPTPQISNEEYNNSEVR